MVFREIAIEVTNKCALRCLHCSSDAGQPIERELSLAEITDLIVQAKGLGGKTLTISGGEPMMRSDLLSILHNDRGMGVRVQTSGCYDFGSGLEPVPDWFLDHFYNGICSRDMITYSVHGRREVHDRITGVQGSYDVVMESIRKTLKRHASMEIHTVPNSLNYDSLEGLGASLQQEGVTKWHLLRLVPQGRCVENGFLSFDAESFRYLRSSVARMLAGPLESILRNGVDKYWSDLSGPIDCCSMGSSSLLVRPDGEVTYCAALKGGFGNIRDHPLKYFWEEHPFVLGIRRFLESGYKELSAPCGSCDVLDACKGGCVAQRLYKYGQDSLLTGPDPLCNRTPTKK